MNTNRLQEVFSTAGFSTEGEKNGSGHSTSAHTPFLQFDIGSDCKATSLSPEGVLGEWRGRKGRRFCSLGFGGAEFDFTAGSSAAIAFNNRLDVTVVRFSEKRDEASFFKIRNLAVDPLPRDFYSSIAFERDGAPLLSIAGFFSGIEIDDVERQKTFMRVDACEAQCTALVQGFAIAAREGSVVEMYSLRDSKGPVVTLGGKKLSIGGAVHRLDHFESLVSVDTSSQLVCFDVRKAARPLLEWENDMGLTFLSHQSFHVDFLTGRVRRLVTETAEEVRVDDEIVDACFDRLNEELLILTKRQGIFVFDENLRVVRHRKMGNVEWRKCALVGRGCGAVVGDEVVSTFHCGG